MKNRTSFLIIPVLFILLISGCATTTFPVGPAGKFSVEVNSIAAPDADLKDKTYVILSSLKNTKESDLQFKEFARYVQNALSLSGYKRVDDINKASIIIGMAYGIGNPKTETDTQVYTTSTGYSYPVGWTWVHVPPQTKKVTTKSTTYLRYLILEAYDSKNKQSVLWKTSLKSVGTGNDLRIVIPHMIAAAIFEIGKNTEKNQRKGMYQNAPRVYGVMQYSQTLGIKPFTGKERFGVMYKLLSFQDQLLYNGQKAGILVLAVAPNSVAQKMGIKRYDIILAVNDIVITRTQEQTLSREINKTKPGEEIEITFFSWKKIREVSSSAQLN